MYNYIKKIYESEGSLKVSDDDNIELEFRIKYDFKSDIDSIVRVINKHKQINSDMAIEKTINCIKSTEQKYTNKIYQVKFIDGSKKRKIIKTYSKEKLGKPMFDSIDGINIKISLSREKTIKKFIAESCDLIRIKSRLSINLINWRLDITLVKTLPYTTTFNLDELEIYTNKMFPKMLIPDNYIEFISNNLKNSSDGFELEVEVEYINIKEMPTENDIKDVINFISSLNINKPVEKTDLYKKLLSRIAVWIQPYNVHKYMDGSFGIKELATQVISLDIFQAHYVLMPNMNNYCISPKIDGDRTILIFDHDNDTYFSLSYNAKELSLLDFGYKNNSVKKGGADNPNETILDAEYYVEDNIPKYYIFDVIAYKGKSIFNEDYEDRIKYIDKILVDFTGCNNLIKKPILNLSSRWKKELKKILKIKWNFETDGWIFTPSKTKGNIRADYIKGKAWKWKPIDVLSIDFLAKLDKSYDGDKKENNYKLYSGIRKKVTEKILPPNSWNNKYSEYGPVIFTPTYLPFNQLNDKKNINISILNNIRGIDINKPEQIIELIWKNNKWEIMRVREDRQIEVDRGNYFGNNHRVAELIWHSIFWPIKPEYFLKSGIIDYSYSLTVVNNNRIYFYKLYSFILRKILYRLNSTQILLVDAGIIYPFLNFIVKFNIKNIDFIVSDGFSCLNIIKQKYDRKFISDRSSQNIVIRAFTPDDYDISIKLEKVEKKRVYISLFPTADQIKHIKKASKIKNIDIYIIVQKKYINSFGSSFSVKSLSAVFNNDMGSIIKDIYMLCKL